MLLWDVCWQMTVCSAIACTCGTYHHISIAPTFHSTLALLAHLENDQTQRKNTVSSWILNYHLGYLIASHHLRAYMSISRLLTWLVQVFECWSTHKVVMTKRQPNHEGNWYEIWLLCFAFAFLCISFFHDMLTLGGERHKWSTRQRPQMRMLWRREQSSRHCTAAEDAPMDLTILYIYIYMYIWARYVLRAPQILQF